MAEAKWADWVRQALGYPFHQFKEGWLLGRGFQASGEASLTGSLLTFCFSNWIYGGSLGAQGAETLGTQAHDRTQPSHTTLSSYNGSSPKRKAGKHISCRHGSAQHHTDTTHMTAAIETHSGVQRLNNCEHSEENKKKQRGSWERYV